MFYAADHCSIIGPSPFIRMQHSDHQTLLREATNQDWSALWTWAEMKALAVELSRNRPQQLHGAGITLYVQTVQEGEQ